MPRLRAASFASAQTPIRLLSVPGDFATIGAALAALGGAGVVEVTDSGRYEETLAINVNGLTCFASPKSLTRALMPAASYPIRMFWGLMSR